MVKLQIVTVTIAILALSIKKHVLTLLLRLELLILLLILLTLQMGSELFLRVILICVGACEGAVGLGSMIRITRGTRTTRIYENKFDIIVLNCFTCQ